MYMIQFVLMNAICICLHIITNAEKDDLTSGGDRVGNAGARIACGVISQRVGEIMALLIWCLLELNVLCHTVIHIYNYADIFLQVKKSE